MSDVNWTQLQPPERSRTYRFPGGDRITFANVVKVEVRPSGMHRLETADGKKAFVRPTWLSMEIDADAWTF